MKFFDGHTTPSPAYIADDWADHKQAWEFRSYLIDQAHRAVRDTLPVEDVPADVVERLQAKIAATKPRQPTAQELVTQVPDVVFWLRSQMTAKALQDDSRPSGKPGSKPPFRVAFMSAADREVAALAYWAAAYGIYPSSPAWRVNGQVAGVYGSDVAVVFELSQRLSEALETTSVLEGMLDDPQYGLWTIRANHVGVWPQLAAIFETATLDEEHVDVDDQLELTA